MTARDSIAHLTVLDALFNFGGIDVSGKNCYKVPPGVEFGEYPLILLRTLISFHDRSQHSRNVSRTFCTCSVSRFCRM